MKLRNLPFRKICIFINEEKITIEKDELFSKLGEKEYNKMKIHILSEFENYLPSAIRKEIIYDNKPIEILYNQIAGYLPPSKRRRLHLITNDLRYSNKLINFGHIEDKFSNIQTILNCELLYLPTFRRIEEDLNNLGLKTESGEEIYNKRINFGMDDVEKLIKYITEDIKNEAMFEYSKMNGEILNDMVNDNISPDQATVSMIDDHSLEIILARIGEINKSKNKSIIQEFHKAQSSSKQTSKFMIYYLAKLMKIYNKQKEKDDRIKAFVKICNTYLVNKEIQYNEALAKVSIVDYLKKDLDIALPKLSSGEKQIVSLFSKLYLEDKKNLIILIDEPELSLSISWQRKLLPDILKSDKCNLLIVTTHSPFIFDNDLDQYADELTRYYTKTKQISKNSIFNDDAILFDLEDD